MEIAEAFNKQTFQLDITEVTKSEELRELWLHHVISTSIQSKLIVLVSAVSVDAQVGLGDALNLMRKT